MGQKMSKSVDNVPCRQRAQMCLQSGGYSWCRGAAARRAVRTTSAIKYMYSHETRDTVELQVGFRDRGIASACCLVR